MKRKIALFVLAAVLAVSCLTGCNKQTDQPGASSTPGKQEHNDAAATTEYVAKFGDETIWLSDFNYFLYDALSEVDFSAANIPEDATDAESYRLMVEYLRSEKEDGVTYFDIVVNRALELCVEFKLTKIKAQEAGFMPEGDDLNKIHSDVDDMADYYLSYYGTSLGAETRDEIMELYIGMNVNEYKRFATEQRAVSDYASDYMEKLEPTDQDLEAFYKENEDQFRVVTVRHILFKTSKTDKDGNSVAMTDAEKEEVRKQAESLMAKVQADIGAIEHYTKGWSEDTNQYGVPNNNGLYDVTSTASYAEEFLKWAVGRKAVSDQLELVETSFGYHIMKCEGITDYYESKGIVASSESTSVEKVKENVKKGFLNVAFQKMIQEVREDSSLETTEINQEAMNKALEDYLLKYAEEDDENNADSTATPDATQNPEETEGPAEG